MKDLRISGPVALIGFATEGRSTLKYLRAQGVQDIVVLDKAPVVDAEELGVRCVHGTDYLKGLRGCRTAVRSAGVYPLQPEILAFQDDGGVLTSQVELFLQATQAPVVGVTGTLGKGSCISMLACILKAAGKAHILGGNFGIPALELLHGDSAERIALLELSSFQLMTVSQPVDVAVVVQTTSEHLDWHKSVHEYRDAKANLVRYQKRSGTLVWNPDYEGSGWIAAQGTAEQKFCCGRGPEANCRVEENALELDGIRLELVDCRIRGRFQLENMAAALLAAKALGVPVQQAIASLREYPGLPYRLQYSGEAKGVRFYNDSYATRPEACMGAVRSFDDPIALVLGGSEKNADFAEMASALAKSAQLKEIALIGDTATRLLAELKKAGATMPIHIHPGLPEAFLACTKAVAKGGVVLLSPACASFGLFPNYKVRGERFDALVREWTAD